MVSSGKSMTGDTKSVEDDEELKRKVRNVFEALNQTGSIPRPKDEGASALEEDKRAVLAQEMQGVDAVMMILDARQVCGACIALARCYED